MSEDAHESETAAALRALRPPAPTRIERRFAIAAILGDRPESRVRVGRLEIQEKLGEGAMGIVYRAFDPELERTVAVKVLRQQAEEHERRRLRSEARALARLNHPCVVGVYGLESSEGDTFVSMEYVPGGTLRKWLDTHPQARWRELLALFLQAAEGLAAAHDAGVIHQDFKPENVLVGQDGRVRVADFGLAWVEVLEAADGSPSSRLIGGTPHFMAPEVMVGSLPSPLSDQYSFCVALRDALNACESTEDDRQLREQLKLAVERGLERDPDRRWSDMRALMRALSRLLAPDPDQHQRSLLMERVEQLWLGGVLADSLSGTEPLPIGLEALFPEDLDRLSLPPGTNVPERRSSDHEQTRFARRVEARSVLELDGLFDGAGRSLAIIGAPGAGKTTALLALTRGLLRRAQVDFSEPVPVVLSLATFDPSRPFTVWLAAELHTKYGVPTRWAERWLAERALVLMLDGLDEVVAARQGECIAAIDALLRAGGAGCVVSCRELAYAELQQRPRVGAVIRVAPVREALVQAVLRRSGATSLIEYWPKDAELRGLLSSPLMLRLAAKAEIGAAEVPRSALLRRRLYAHFVAHLLARVSEAPAAREQMARGLTWLAQAMIRTGTSDVWLERLQADWLREPIERRWVRAGGVALVTVGILIGVLVVTLGLGMPLWSGGLGAALALLACFGGLRTTEVRVVEGVRWAPARSLRWLPVGLVGGALVGGLLALRYWFVGGNAAEPDLALRGSLTQLGYGALFGLFGAFVAGLEPGDRATRAEPGEGLRDSFKTALAVSFPAALATLLGVSYVLLPVLERNGVGLFASRFSLGASTATLVGLATFFNYGGAAVSYHWALRAVIALRTPVPLALRRFLDEATRAGILRRVGGGYLFMHRTLRDYFASLDDEVRCRAVSDSITSDD